MSILYVTEQGAEVGLLGERLDVRKGRAHLASVRIDECAQVVLMGNVQLTPKAARACLEAGADVLLMTRGGRFLGRLSGGLAGHIDLRRAQHRRSFDPVASLVLARAYVRGKIRNMTALLRRYQRDRQDDRIASALLRLRDAPGALERADGVEVVMGVEGAASREYFAAFGRLIEADGISFTARLRRPPPDPVNILLSFGYTLLAGALSGMVEQAGLDPYLGSLHAPERGRPSLVLDLMEEFRPVIVDSLVLRVLNTKAIRKADFIWPEAGEEAEVEDAWERDALEAGGETEPAVQRRVVFSQTGVRKWLTAFERRMEEGVEYPRQGRHLAFRQVLREQVYLLARSLLGEDEYESFRYRG